MLAILDTMEIQEQEYKDFLFTWQKYFSFYHSQICGNRDKVDNQNYNNN